jgi:hypothetical protein
MRYVQKKWDLFKKFPQFVDFLIDFFCPEEATLGTILTRFQNFHISVSNGVNVLQGAEVVADIYDDLELE